MMKINIREKHIPVFPLCLLAAAALTVLPCLFADIFYMYGDDYLINYIANGSFGETYQAHLIFVGYPLGLLLKGLYHILPGVNWYAVLLLAGFALSFALFYDSLARCGAHPAAYALIALINVAAAPLFLTYTAAAFFTAAAGLAFVLVRLRGGAPLRCLLPGLLFMALSLEFRSDCLLPACALAFPLYAACLLQKDLRADGAWKKRLLTFAGAGLILLALIGALRLVEKRAYSTEAWQDFRSYNSARSDWLDYPLMAYEDFADAYTEAGFTKEAYLILNRWTFCEKQTFSKERLLAISQIQKQAYTKGFRLSYTLEAFSSKTTLLLLLIPAALFLMLLIADREARRLPLCLTFLMLLLVLGALAFIRMRFLLRVAAPLAVADIVFLAINAPRRERKLSLPLALISAALLFVPCFLFLPAYNEAVASLRSASTAASYRKLRKEIDAHPERIYAVESPIYVHLFAWGHTIDEIKPTDTFSHVFRAGSWDNFTPRYYALAEAAGVPDPDNLLSSLIDSGRMRLVTENEDFVLQFLTAETGTPCVAQKVNKKGPARIIKVGSAS